MNKKFNIAIDGHSGSGKSSIAKELSKRLGFKRLDTGALYRAVACQWLENNETEINEKNVCKFVKSLDVRVEFDDYQQKVFINEKDFTPFLRTEQISMLSVKLSPYCCVREKIKSLQRNFALNNDCIIEGRDIGSEILPDADVKFFITADAKIRAERRHNQNLQMGYLSNYETILEHIKNRDFLDETRVVSPLKRSNGDFLIDNSVDSFDNIVDKCLKIINALYKNNND